MSRKIGTGSIVIVAGMTMAAVNAWVFAPSESEAIEERNEDEGSVKNLEEKRNGLFEEVGTTRCLCFDTGHEQTFVSVCLYGLCGLFGPDHFLYGAQYTSSFSLDEQDQIYFIPMGHDKTFLCRTVEGFVASREWRLAVAIYNFG